MTIEQRREYQRNRYRKGKEGVRVYDGRSAPENVEYHKELKKKYYEAHKEELAKKAKEKRSAGAVEKTPVVCECGMTLKHGNMDRHLASAGHENKMFKKAIKNKLEEERKALFKNGVVKPFTYLCKGEVKPTLYRCDRGIHKGRLLCDVVQFHPGYIDFLIKNHRDTFPEDFKQALLDCSVDIDKYKVVEDEKE